MTDETRMPTPDEERRKLATVGVLVTAAVALGAGLYVLQSVALPLVMALFLVYVVDPLVDFMEMRLRWPRWAAVVLTLLVGLALMGALVVLVVGSVSGLEEKADLYQQRLTAFGKSLLGWFDAQGLGIDAAAIEAELRSMPFDRIARDALGSVADVLSKSVLTLLFFLFIVIGGSAWEEKSGVWEQIDRSVKRYLRTKVLTSAAIGIVFGGVLFGFGIDLAFVFGVLGFLLNFIPTIGSIVALLLPVPLIFVAVEPATGLLIVGILVLAQNVIGNGLEPKLMGAGLDLHPATILIGLGIWGLIWGVVGMLLSAPLMAIIRIVLRRYETTRPFAELLAGRVGRKARKGTVTL